MKGIFNIIPGPQEDVCCILLYGEIGYYADVTATDVVSRVLEAERTYRKIDIHINSIGGEVATGIAIFNALRQSKAEITIYIDGIAASTASFIAGCGHPVKMSRYAQMMLHRPSVCSYGDVDELKRNIQQLEQVENILCEIYSARTGRTPEEIKATYMDGEDHWLTAPEALELGFVDEIYDDPLGATFTDSLAPDEWCERYTADYINSIVSHNTNKQMINKIKAIPAFSDCADEAAIMARISENENKARERDAVAAERDALKGKVEEFERKEREAAEAAYDAEVDRARAEERIGADEVANFKALMRKDAENTRAIIATRKPKRRVMAVLDEQQGGASVRTDKELLDARKEEVRASLKNK